MPYNYRPILLCLSLLFGHLYGNTQTIRLGIPIGHNSVVESAHFSPSNKYLMTTSKDGTTNVWRVSDGLLIYNIPSKKVREGYNWTPSARFSSKGDLMLTTTSDSTVKIYDFTKGVEVMTIDDGVGIRDAQFTSDDRFIISASSKVVVWDAKTGEKIRVVDSIDIEYSEFSYMRFFIDPEMNFLITSRYAGSLDVWNFKDFSYLRHIDTYDEDFFSTDGKYVLSVKSLVGFLGCWEVATGERVYRKMLRLAEIFDLTFSPDNKYFTVDNTSRSSKLYHVASGDKYKAFDSDGEYTNFIEVSPNGKDVAVVGYGGDLELREMDHETIVPMVAHKDVIGFVGFSEDGHYMVSSDESGHLMLWDAQKKVLLHDLSGEISRIEQAAYSADGSRVATLHANGVVRLLNTKNGRQIKEWRPAHETGFDRVCISPDGTLVAFAAIGFKSYFYNTQDDSLVAMNGSVLCSYQQDRFIVQDREDHWVAVSPNNSMAQQVLDFSLWYDYVEGVVTPDNNYLIASKGWFGEQVMVIDLSNGEEVLRTTAKSYGYQDISVLAVSPDSKKVVLALRDFNENEVVVVNLEDGEPIGRIEPEMAMTSAAFSALEPTKLMVSGGSSEVFVIDITAVDDEALFTKVQKRTYSASMVSDIHWSESKPMVVLDKQRLHFDCGHDQMVDVVTFNDGSWVHLNEHGQFDASPRAMEKMYWVQGEEVINFEQLKSQFWIPGLMNKNVSGRYESRFQIEDVKLGPEVISVEVKDGVLNARLRKRSGGYGNVALYVNGKEVSEDIRPSDFDANETEQVIQYDISELKQLTSNNHIVIKANSQDGLIQGRGAGVVYNKKQSNEATPTPKFFGVILGVGAYADSTMDLRFSVPDAEAIALSVKLGAEKFFGPDRTEIHSYNTSNGNQPTKANIKKVFDEIAAESNPEDVIFIYMSGHGINSGGVNGDFYYLTSEARSSRAEDYSGGQIPEAISTAEFTSWLKQAAALKQVMVIDACGSGKAVENLSEARSLDMSQIKAIDRMKDKTGMFVISGCAADAVSYEASRFGQGLLTYAVLQAMKGAALRENRFVDVSTILQFAKDEVPDLAKDINGIQEPQLLLPNSGSFDIGILDDADRSKIPLQDPKPVYIRSLLLNRNEGTDDLKLSLGLDQELYAFSGRGSHAKWVFFNASEYSNARKVTGFYELTEGMINGHIFVSGEGFKKDFKISAPNKKEFLSKVVEALETL